MDWILFVVFNSLNHNLLFEKLITLNIQCSLCYWFPGLPDQQETGCEEGWLYFRSDIPYLWCPKRMCYPSPALLLIYTAFHKQTLQNSTCLQKILSWLDSSKTARSPAIVVTITWLHLSVSLRPHAASRRIAKETGLVVTGRSYGVTCAVRLLLYKMADFRTCSFEYFPDNLLIEILSYLSIRELVRAGR